MTEAHYTPPSRPATKRARRPASSFLDPASIETRFYGLVLAGDCMEPLLKDGTRIVVDREAPCLCGDLAVIYHRPELVPPGELPLSVKRLITAVPDWVKFPWKDHPDSEVAPVLIVEMLNPKRQFSVLCRNLLAVHRCLGSMDDPKVREQLLAEGWRI